MKTTEKKDKRLEIRVSDEDLKLLKVASYTIGQTPSKLIRMFIDSTINTLKMKIRKGELNLEDYQALWDDKL